MVEGLQRKRLTVVDLDGTLVCGNTLHEYIRLGFHRAGFSKKLAILWLSALRGVKLISHPTFKFGCIKRIEPTADFAEHIRGMFNPSVIALLDGMRADGMTILLATAAADVYVPYIWDGEYLATPTAERRELRGARKLRAVEQYMREHDCELYAVVTDHYDDLPLLSAGAMRNILVNPSEKTLRLLKESGVSNIEVI